jgi:hypothetical protein
MIANEIDASLKELARSSRISVGLIIFGVVFLAATVYYSATRLGPLEMDIKTKREQIAQLEAKRAELALLAAAADNPGRPAQLSMQESTGWVYLGRVSSTGDWAPQSDRVKSTDNPKLVTPGSSITTLQNVSLVDNIETQNDDKPSGGQSQQKPNFFIRPDTELRVSAVREQPSIGGGKIIWAQVQLSSESLVQIGH